MSNRKSTKTVTSGGAFVLWGSDEVGPPDGSSVDTDELDASLKREQGRVRINAIEEQ